MTCGVPGFALLAFGVSGDAAKRITDTAVENLKRNSWGRRCAVGWKTFVLIRGAKVYVWINRLDLDSLAVAKKVRLDDTPSS